MNLAGGMAGGTMMTVAGQTILSLAGQEMADSPSVIIIGAGPSGIAMAHELKHKLGFEDFTIYEKLDVIGGTWATNRYPGCGCDVPTHLYSFSFNLNPHWSKELCDQEEILEYMNSTVDKFDLRSHMHTSIEVVQAQWIEDKNTWSVRLKDLKTDIEYTRYSTIFISAVGGISYPRDVKFDGMDRFQGEMFHTARWPTTWGLDGMDGIEGKRVAVIGNGCSAAQLVPKLVKKARFVKQYARSPQWYHERPNAPISKTQEQLFQYVPFYQRLHRLLLFLANDKLVATYLPGPQAASARAKVEQSARDYILSTAPEKYHNILIPDFPLGCKRRIFDPEYLASLHAENLQVVQEDIKEITEHGIVGATGGEHSEFDVIVLATGFQVTQFLAPMDIVGARDGVSLEQYWKETRGAQAYWGSLVAGFPNFGILFGPNTFPAHNSALFACEVSISYLSRVLIAPILDGRATRVEVRQAVEDRWAASIQAKLRGSVYEAGCSNWYINEYGRNVVSWPGLASRYWLGTWLDGSRGVVYKGGGNGWWVNMLVRWIKCVPGRVWILLALAAVLGRVKAVRARVDRGMERYVPYEKQVLDAVGKFKETVGQGQ